MNLLPEVAAYLAKARHALEVAGKLRAADELADAAGKAYYAMFYAAQALLRAHGKNLHQTRGLQHQFSNLRVEGVVGVGPVIEAVAIPTGLHQVQLHQLLQVLSGGHPSGLYLRVLGQQQRKSGKRYRPNGDRRRRLAEFIKLAGRSLG